VVDAGDRRPAQAQPASRRWHASNVRRGGLLRAPEGRRSVRCGVCDPDGHADCSVTVGTNAYSVPWRLIGERVRVVVSDGRVRVYHDRDVVAEHDEQHWQITDPGAPGGDSTRVRFRSSTRMRTSRRACDRFANQHVPHYRTVVRV